MLIEAATYLVSGIVLWSAAGGIALAVVVLVYHLAGKDNDAW